MSESESLKKTISRIYEWMLHTPPLMVFNSAILDIEKLSEFPSDSAWKTKHNQLLYANVITALETYLLDTFITTLFKDEAFKMSLLSGSNDFKSERYTLKEFYEKGSDIEEIIKEKLFDISWHNLSKVESLYRCALNIKLPPERESLHKAILIRHDIVHRNGKGKNGGEILISSDMLATLVEDAERFVLKINSSILRLVKKVHRSSKKK